MEAIEEVVPDDDDCGAAGRPTLARADRLDAWGRYGKGRVQAYMRQGCTIHQTGVLRYKHTDIRHMVSEQYVARVH